MYQMSVGQAGIVGGGNVVTDAVTIFGWGYTAGTVLNSAVDELGGWGEYFTQVGSALGSME